MEEGKLSSRPPSFPTFLYKKQFKPALPKKVRESMGRALLKEGVPIGGGLKK